jgi:uncharacterized membrane protein
LVVGVIASAALVGIGFVSSFFVGWTGGSPDQSPTDFSGLAERLFALQPLAIAQAGLLLLVATPIFRVAVSVVGFASERDALYVALSAIVLVLLVLSLGLLR